MMRYGGRNVKLAAVGSIGHGSDVEHNLCSTSRGDEPALPIEMVTMGYYLGLLGARYRTMVQTGAGNKGSDIHCRHIAVCDSVRAGGDVAES